MRRPLDSGSLNSFMNREGQSSMDFCDLGCKYASFPTSEAADGSYSCRTFIALYCKK